MGLPLALLTCSAVLCTPTPLPSLPSLRNATTITASGISSGIILMHRSRWYVMWTWSWLPIAGAFMAHQLHVAFSANVNGTGLIAVWYTICARLRINSVYIFLAAVENNSRVGHTSVLEIHRAASSKPKQFAWKNRISLMLIHSSR